MTRGRREGSEEKVGEGGGGGRIGVRETDRCNIGDCRRLEESDRVGGGTDRSLARLHWIGL